MLGTNYGENSGVKGPSMTEHGQFESGENLNGMQVIDFMVEPSGMEPTTS